MRLNKNAPAGKVHTLRVNASMLAENLLGDPAERDVFVYVPHDHDGSGLPLLVDLVGLTGSGAGRASWKNFG